MRARCYDFRLSVLGGVAIGLLAFAVPAVATVTSGAAALATSLDDAWRACNAPQLSSADRIAHCTTIIEFGPGQARGPRAGADGARIWVRHPEGFRPRARRLRRRDPEQPEARRRLLLSGSHPDAARSEGCARRYQQGNLAQSEGPRLFPRAQLVIRQAEGISARDRGPDHCDRPRKEADEGIFPARCRV